MKRVDVKTSSQRRSRRAGQPSKPSKGRSRIPVWTIFAAAFLVALGALYVISGLRSHVDVDQRTALLLADLETQGYRLSALEWQAVAERQFSSEIAEEVRDAKARVSSIIDELTRLHLESEEEEALEAWYIYDAATDEEFRLLEAGELEEALEVDEELVDPSFEEFTEALRESSSSFNEHAQQYNQLANWGSGFILVLAAGLIGLLFWMFERARRSAESLRIQSLEARAAGLRERNRELQDFVRIASHDLQEPLRKVRAFGDRVKTKYADSLDDRGRDYLERMEGASARMQDLIDDLLSLSRITSQARPFEPVDLTEVTNEVVSDLGTRIEDTGGRVEVGELPTVEADRSQVRQLLQNLISNALKFHKENETPVVKVYGQLLEEREEDLNGEHAGGRARIMVEDNGVGFEEKYLEYIFAPFQRLHGNDAYEGTGMGLAICRRVAERHGGKITVQSTPGRGAVFIVTLPVEQLEGAVQRR